MLTFVALLVMATPDLRAARACMGTAEAQYAACVEVAEGYVAVELRGEARGRCDEAYRVALEQCLVANGVVVSEARRALWREHDEAVRALRTCAARVEREAQWCIERAADAAADRACRSTATRALTACEEELARREAGLAAKLRALELEELRHVEAPAADGGVALEAE